MPIEDLLGMLDACKKDIFEDLGDSLRVLLLYGSFTYQDLNRKVNTYNSLYGKEGLFDRKLDFICVTDDIKKALKGFWAAHSFNQEGLDKLLGLSLKTNFPYFFQVKTKREHDLGNKFGDKRIGYKIGLIGEEEFFSCNNEYDIMLKSRLCKFFNEIHIAEDLKEDFEEYISFVRDSFLDLTIRMLPSNFSGEEFMRAYQKTTYLAEAYRVFDLVNKRYMSILDSVAFDVKEGRQRPMRQIMKHLLEEKLYSHPDIKIKTKASDFCESIFQNGADKDRLNILYQFFRYNLESIRIAYFKSRISNSAAGNSNLQYVARKFGIRLPEKK